MMRIARRLAGALLIALLASTAIFLLLELAPGDPSVLFTDVEGSADVNARNRELLGLDAPLPIRFARWIGGTVTLDFGTSIVQHRPVRDLVLEALPHTLALSGAALLLGFGAGLGLAFLCARRPGGRLDRILTFGSLLFSSAPIFWVAALAVWWFSVAWAWFPTGGELSIANRFTPGLHLADRLHHLALPTLVLGAAVAGQVARFARAALVDAMQQDFVLASRARGSTRMQALRSQGLPFALRPIFILLGLSVPAFVGGSVLVESVFAWPGMGSLLLGAIVRKDFPVVAPCVFLLSLLTVLGNAAADELAARLDPRTEAA